jgi:HEAT repeat protein
MKRAAFAAALLVSFAPASFAQLALPRDGWATWTVEAPVEGAPAWCCLQWKRKPASMVACDLDDRGGSSYGTIGRADRSDTMRIYARLVDGKVDKVRALAPACEASTRTPPRDLGSVSPADSARWLASQLPSSGRHILDDMLAALSVHRGSAPTLIAIATSNENPKVREQAWFWLSQVAAPETEAAIATALRKEPDRHVREQAIFALSQLPHERGAKALVAVVEDRSLPREDRRHAIFWLGQSDSEYATAYLDRLLNNGR